LLALTYGASSSDGVPSLRSQEKTRPASQLPPPDLVTLEVGKAIERNLSGGQSHWYQITLAEGQYLHFVVDQRGIDVVVVLYGPDGNKLIDVDSPNGRSGPEPLSWIAERTGTYRIEVRSLEENAKAGNYGVEIETLGQVTTQDGHRVQAEKSYAEGLALAAQGTAQSLRGALGKFSAALDNWRAAAEQHQEAATLNYLGKVHFSLGENQNALDYFSQALPIMRRLGNRSGEAAALNNIGSVYAALGEKQKALEKYNEALPIIRHVGDRRGHAATLNNIGEVYQSLGEHQKAIEKLNEALPIREAGRGSTRGGGYSE
jgi:tetratricopeptide (TPR) repeat protein